MAIENQIVFEAITQLIEEDEKPKKKIGYIKEGQGIQKLIQAVAKFDGEKLTQAVAEIPWGHNILLLEKLKSPSKRLWYAVKTKELGWSRTVLAHQIEIDLCRSVQIRLPCLPRR